MTDHLREGDVIMWGVRKLKRREVVGWTSRGKTILRDLDTGVEMTGWWTTYGDLPELAHYDKNETRILRAERAIASHGFSLHYVDYCEDAETPGILGVYAGVTSHDRRKVKIATKHRTREQIADALEHELHHVEDPLWDCGSGGGVLGHESGAARRRREAGL